MSSAQMIKILEELGWTLDRQKGSHRTYKHAQNPKIITIPHPERDLSPGLLRTIKRIAGIK